MMPFESWIRSAIFSLVALGFLGCGGVKPAPPPKVIPSQSQVIVPTISSPPSKLPPPPAPNNSVSEKEKKPNPLPPGTDPFSVFEISATNQRTRLEPAQPRPEDQFQVESGQQGVDSTNLIVASIPSIPGRTARSGFTLPAGFVSIPAAGYSSTGLPLRVRCEKTDSVLALVPAGAVVVGSDSGPPECRPEFSVHLDTYYLEVFEVTVEEFEKYRVEMKEKKKPVPTILNPSASPKSPALGVQWGVGQAFARWAGMELPTEAELEKAARGPNSLRTPWGDGRAVWSSQRTSGTITPVGSFSTDVSVYGIYDLAGNAREWCSDLYSEQAHRDALGNGNAAPHNWAGPKKVSNGNLRTVKGNGPDWSAWHRQGRDIGKALPDVGLRCVLRMPSADSATGT